MPPRDDAQGAFRAYWIFNLWAQDAVPILDGGWRVWLAARHESSWAQTFPGEGYNLALHLYGHLAPWFDQSWRLGDLEEPR